ncbi:haloacid dehalogenase type II [Saccharopolyspora sp. ASAGF58]|uniref:haloacid dehalogenase type II n=1 Tax=Saccharopolyspora sp. ASAGF58 TaxID=2719023 RepID=UPI00143FD429|nr:haloacid dehalogenase type II [Saccharopolyspora sp. ASAGF58]QIZ37644.1 haloacid dehalogenase type II [Saccharopolyspora sp. ASAGF58]
MAIDVCEIRVLFFDVLGTVVDEAGSAADEFERAVHDATGQSGHGKPLAATWFSECTQRLNSILGGESWAPLEEINRHALATAVEEQGLTVDASALDRLALVTRRLRPWPDAAPALRALSGRFTLAALSNATTAMLAAISRRGALPWHCVLSSELVRSYKPDPVVYAMALDLLRVEPEQSMLVAAHPWDLRAAAAKGIRTAYVARAGEGAPEPTDAFDVEVDDLTHLARTLIE